MLKRSFLFMMVLILMIILVTGCGGQNENNNVNNGSVSTDTEEPSKKKDTIKFAYIAMPQAAPQALINREDKIFDNQLQKMGKKVEFVATRSLDNIWPMMDGDEGDPDFVYLPTANFSTYVTETSRFGGSDKYVIISGSINTNTTVLITKPGIESLKDLDGKKVGLANQRYSDEYQFNKMLSTVGLATNSVGGTVEVIYDDIVKAELDNFANGTYDAIIIYDPMNFKWALSKVPGSQILTSLNPDGMFGEVQPRSWLVAKKELLKNDPDLVKEVLKAHILATDKSKEEVAKLPAINREIFINYFEELGADLTDIKKTHNLEFYEKKWQEVEITYDPNMDYVKGVFDFMKKKGVVEGKSIDDFVQVKLFNDVLEELGRETI